MTRRASIAYLFDFRPQNGHGIAVNSGGIGWMEIGAPFFDSSQMNPKVQYPATNTPIFT